MSHKWNDKKCEQDICCTSHKSTCSYNRAVSWFKFESPNLMWTLRAFWVWRAPLTYLASLSMVSNTNDVCAIASPATMAATADTEMTAITAAVSPESRFSRYRVISVCLAFLVIGSGMMAGTRTNKAALEWSSQQSLRPQFLKEQLRISFPPKVLFHTTKMKRKKKEN